MKQNDIDEIFTYHKPVGNQQEVYEMIRTQCKNLVETINDLVPESREKSMAITSIQQASMWANAGIAIHSDVEEEEKEEHRFLIDKFDRDRKANYLEILLSTADSITISELQRIVSATQIDYESKDGFKAPYNVETKERGDGDLIVIFRNKVEKINDL